MRMDDQPAVLSGREAEDLHSTRPLPLHQLQRSGPSQRPVRSNATIAARLREAADLLERQKANPFRVRAFRRAAIVAFDRTGRCDGPLR